MYETELYHHGVKGMQWGKRNGPPYPLYRKTSYYKEHGTRPPGYTGDKKGASAGSTKKGSVGAMPSPKPHDEKSARRKKILKRVAIGAGIAAGTALAAYGAHKAGLDTKVINAVKNKRAEIANRSRMNNLANKYESMASKNKQTTPATDKSLSLSERIQRIKAKAAGGAISAENALRNAPTQAGNAAKSAAKKVTDAHKSIRHKVYNAVTSKGRKEMQDSRRNYFRAEGYKNAVDNFAKENPKNIEKAIIQRRKMDGQLNRRMQREDPSGNDAISSWMKSERKAAVAKQLDLQRRAEKLPGVQKAANENYNQMKSAYDSVKTKYAKTQKLGKLAANAVTGGIAAAGLGAAGGTAAAIHKVRSRRKSKKAKRR